MKALTRCEQYTLLKRAKTKLEAKQDSFVYGLCPHLRDEIASYVDVPFIHDNEIQDYIPCFTYENICFLTQGTDLYPTGTIHWWTKGEAKIRIKVLDLLINELTNITL